MPLRAAIYRKLIQPFIDLLKQGVTPEKIALTVALGVSLGVTPVIGSTTMLCTLAAVTLPESAGDYGGQRRGLSLADRAAGAVPAGRRVDLSRGRSEAL